MYILSFYFRIRFFRNIFAIALSGNDNSHSFACVRLFLHASTKVSCVGFVIWCPSGRLPRVVCFVFDQSIVASDNRLSYACILLFPTGTKVSRGVPDFPLVMTESALRVINCAFNQSFHAKSENACLLLVYSFSPRVQSIPRGPRIFARNDKILRTERNHFKND